MHVVLIRGERYIVYFCGKEANGGKWTKIIKIVALSSLLFFCCCCFFFAEKSLILGYLRQLESTSFVTVVVVNGGFGYADDWKQKSLW